MYVHMYICMYVCDEDCSVGYPNPLIFTSFPYILFLT